VPEEISVNHQLARLVVGIILESSGSEEAIGLLVDHCSPADLGLVYQKLALERGDPTRRTGLFEQLGSDECVELLELAALKAQGGKDYRVASAPYSQKVWRRIVGRIRSIDPSKD
jgi:hypothetical protein